MTIKAQNRLLNSGQRIYALDAMRALLAILGVFFHAGLSHVTHLKAYHIPWHITSTQVSPFFNWLVCWIHSFRMPAFFFLSGFLSYLIYKKTNLTHLTSSRIKRILIPFSIVWLLPSIFGFTMLYLDPGLQHKILTQNIFSRLNELGVFWFLYYLLIFDVTCIAIISLNKLFNNVFQRVIEKIKNNSLLNALSFAVLILMPLTVLELTSQSRIPTSLGIVPDFGLLALYGSFFILGWCLHNHYQYLINFAKRYWISLFFLSLAAISVHMHEVNNFTNPFSPLMPLSFCISSIAMLFSILGFTLHFLNKKNRVVQYLADSSYWIYISQITIILFMGSMLSYTSLGAISMYSISVVSTIAICLLTYQLIIRNRKIFRYIDGTSKKIQRQTRAKNAVVKAPKVA